MSRKRLAILLAIPTLVIVLLVGLTRDRNTNEDTEQATPTTEPPSQLSTGSPFLQPADEVIDVEAGSDCRATTDDESPSCEGFDVLGQEVAWVVEQSGDEPPVASFLRRSSPTQWQRVLRAGGSNLERPFERVNVRVDDLTGDGAIETIYGFHGGDDLAVDVVDAAGAVLLHLDLPDGQVLVGGGQLITFVREGEGWRREEIAAVDGELDVRLSEIVEGPPEGNL